MPYYRDPYQETLQGLGSVANVARGFSDLKDRNTARERQDTEYSRQEEGREAYSNVMKGGESSGIPVTPETMSGRTRALADKEALFRSEVAAKSRPYYEKVLSTSPEQWSKLDPATEENPPAAFMGFSMGFDHVSKLQDIKKKVSRTRLETGKKFFTERVTPALSRIKTIVSEQGEKGYNSEESKNILQALAYESVTPWYAEENKSGNFDVYWGTKDEVGENKKVGELTPKELYEKTKAYNEETYVLFSSAVKEGVKVKNAAAINNPILFPGKGGKEAYGFQLVDPNNPNTSTWHFFTKDLKPVLSPDGTQISSIPGLIQAGYTTEKQAKGVMERQKHNMEMQTKKVAIKEKATTLGVKIHRAIVGKAETTMFPGDTPSPGQQEKTQKQVEAAINQMESFLNGKPNATDKDIADEILKAARKSKLTDEQKARVIALAEELKKGKAGKPGQEKPAPAGIPEQTGSASPEKPRMGINQGTWPSGGGF